MFEEKTVLITGGSRGIGRALAIAFAQRGARVAVNFVSNAAAADETVDRIETAGGRATAVQADVRDTTQVKAMIERIETAYGPVSILVNNAGILRDKPIMFMSDAEWDDVVDVDLRGAFTCIKGVGREMMRNRNGRIINISSAAGILGDAMRANYAAAKAGLIGLTRTAAREFAKSGTTVNAIAPGMIETDMIRDITDAKRAALLERIPMGHAGSADQVASVALFLASDQAAYVTGQVVCVDGGLCM